MEYEIHCDIPESLLVDEYTFCRNCGAPLIEDEINVARGLCFDCVDREEE